MTSKYFSPCARCCVISTRILSTSAFSLIGSTIPDVPRIEMPPLIPSRGLNVFAAIFSPSGTEIVAFRLPSYWYLSAASSSALHIMERGTGLIAASPTFCESPGLVTLPTPIPPSTIQSLFPEILSTFAYTSTPSVVSGSSPACLRTAHVTELASIVMSCNSR